MNIWDIVIIAAVVIAAAAAIVFIIKRKSRGCSGNCGCCTMNCDKREKR